MMNLFEHTRTIRVTECPICGLLFTLSAELCDNCGWDLDKVDAYECTECGNVYAYGEEAEGHWESEHEYQE